jgi:hypothetical protein
MSPALAGPGSINPVGLLDVAGWQWLARPSLLPGAATLACYVAMGLVRVFQSADGSAATYVVEVPGSLPSRASVGTGARDRELEPV